ncbi:MAG: cytochrome b/b6 domain-containing protein [Anaerolineales bacterium]|nr:cytochrome b/b6 domain-containing protein [Anaerolineales bacterium]
MKTTVFHRKTLLVTGLALLALTALALGVSQALAHRPAVATPQISPLHPPFALLDSEGQNVLQSGRAISTMQTCGQCHDTAFIESHSFHADLGLKTGGGLYGKWDPLTYRYLSQPGDKRLDLSTAEWLMINGARIPGGGPATTSRSGQPLSEIAPNPTNPEAAILNSATGQPEGWDWSKSGVMEMNCFLCHLPQPNLSARAEEIRAGRFGQANTATLLGTGWVERTPSGFAYNPAAFGADGKLKAEFVRIQDPTNENCAACHGEVHVSNPEPLLVSACDLNYHQTATTGQVFAGQKISLSGVNLQGKQNLNRAWDIHAERGLQCTDCHYSLNNPAHALSFSAPGHLAYDPRKLEIGEYLLRPDHNFARGQSAQFTVAPSLKGTMRRCESCHNAVSTHSDWLPYTSQHMSVLACESCHIPQMYAPAIQSYDWTVISLEGSPTRLCRGLTGDDTVNNLVTGYQPVLMQRTNIDGQKLLAPYNLVTTFYWVYDSANGPRPVREIDLKAAYLSNGQYASEIVAAFDTDKNGQIDPAELRTDTIEKQAAVAARLEALGLENPRIEGQIQPYSINHNVAGKGHAIRECTTCHHENSRVTAPLQLTTYTPAGVMPQFVGDTNVNLTGEIVSGENGALFYQPVTIKDGVYVFGRDRVPWVDWFGALAFVGTLFGVAGHGTLRYLSWLKRPKHQPVLKSVYMYEAYERFWHWLQTFSILFLLLSGLVIHRPDMFGAFSFPHMVLIHNVLAAILILNFLFALFWHVTTGEVRQYIPNFLKPVGIINDMVVQIKFYTIGIFKGEPHPFEKRREKKLNPLQQFTYFGLLTVLLPLQMLSGALMWGVQQWPQIASWFGGLPFLAPLHSLIAWLLGAFIVGHVYLTTTGATPLEAMRAMVTGWEEVESEHHHS